MSEKLKYEDVIRAIEYLNQPSNYKPPTWNEFIKEHPWVGLHMRMMDSRTNQINHWLRYPPKSKKREKWLKHIRRI